MEKGAWNGLELKEAGRCWKMLEEASDRPLSCRHHACLRRCHEVPASGKWRQWTLKFFLKWHMDAPADSFGQVPRMPAIPVPCARRLRYSSVQHSMNRSRGVSYRTLRPLHGVSLRTISSRAVQLEASACSTRSRVNIVGSVSEQSQSEPSGPSVTRLSSCLRATLRHQTSVANNKPRSSTSAHEEKVELCRKGICWVGGKPIPKTSFER